MSTALPEPEIDRQATLVVDRQARVVDAGRLWSTAAKLVDDQQGPNRAPLALVQAYADALGSYIAEIEALCASVRALASMTEDLPELPESLQRELSAARSNAAAHLNGDARRALEVLRAEADRTEARLLTRLQIEGELD